MTAIQFSTSTDAKLGLCLPFESIKNVYGMCPKSCVIFWFFLNLYKMNFFFQLFGFAKLFLHLLKKRFLTKTINRKKHIKECYFNLQPKWLIEMNRKVALFSNARL